MEFACRNFRGPSSLNNVVSIFFGRRASLGCLQPNGVFLFKLKNGSSNTINLNIKGAADFDVLMERVLAAFFYGRGYEKTFDNL